MTPRAACPRGRFDPASVPDVGAPTSLSADLPRSAVLVQFEVTAEVLHTGFEARLALD